MAAFTGALQDYSGGALTVLCACALVAGLARGFSGFGAALIFMPLASGAVGPKVAVPLLLVVDAVAMAALIPNAWNKADRRDVAVMTLGALVGVPLGTLALTSADPVAIRWGICVLTASLLMLLMSGWRYHGRPKAVLTVGVGAISGFFSGIAQVGGPPVVAYWLGGAGAPDTVRANIVLYFAISTVFTVASYWIGGLFTASVFVLATVATPLYGIGVWFGSRLFGTAGEQTFRRICYLLIAIAAVLGLPLLDGVLR